jgi:hypothetical protein
LPSTVNRRADVRFGAGSAGFLSMTLGVARAEARFVDQEGKELYVTTIALP